MGFALMMLMRALFDRQHLPVADDCEPCWLHDFGIGECHGCGQ